MPGKWIDIKVDGDDMEGYLAQPEEEGRYPAVLVIQEVWGVNSHIQSVTDRLPGKGYVGLSPAMFHRQGRMLMGLHEEMDTAIQRMSACVDDEIIADIQAAVNYLRSLPSVDPDKIGITGFCFGGRVTYLGACTVPEIKAAAVYYGGRILQPLGIDGPSPVERTSGINGPILGLFGEDDANPSPGDVAQIEAELKKQGKTYSFHMYPGAGHGFLCDARASYRRDAALDAWDKTIAWFDEHLKG